MLLVLGLQVELQAFRRWSHLVVDLVEDRQARLMLLYPEHQVAAVEDLAAVEFLEHRTVVLLEQMGLAAVEVLEEAEVLQRAQALAVAVEEVAMAAAVVAQKLIIQRLIL
jgi:hypothetical protein